MGNTVDNNTFCKEIGKSTLAVSAGAGTYATAYILSGKLSNHIGNSGFNTCQENNSAFKSLAEKALKNEKIFCTTLDEAFIALWNTSLNSNELELKNMRAGGILISSPTDWASKINNKIDEPYKKIITKIIPDKKDSVIEQTNKGLNAMVKKDVVFADLDKVSMATFHEMGHVKNYQSKRVGKLLQTLKHPLLKKIAIVTALAGVLIPPNKKNENERENQSAYNKVGNFIKDNCVSISALATVPTVLEEGLASIKGAKIASKVMSSDKLKMLNKVNGKAFLTYVIGSTLLPLGIYVAKKTREAVA
jgi:hypothetical protein